MNMVFFNKKMWKIPFKCTYLVTGFPQFVENNERIIMKK